jgi:hypothetical protein
MGERAEKKVGLRGWNRKGVWQPQAPGLVLTAAIVFNAYADLTFSLSFFFKLFPPNILRPANMNA